MDTMTTNTAPAEPTPMPTTPWMDARGAAAYLGRKSKFAYKTMVRLAKEKRIKAGHDGKRFLFRVEDLDAFLYFNRKKVRS